MDARTAPQALMSHSHQTLHTMFTGGARGASLLEQGSGWCTWTYGNANDLLIAARALIEAGYRHVDMRYRPGVLELYCAR